MLHRRALLLIVVALLLGNVSTQVFKSSQLGAIKCIQHLVYNRTLVLYTWLSACAPPNEPNSLYVSASFFMYDPYDPSVGKNDEFQLDQANEVVSWLNVTRGLRLRSPHSNQTWPFKWMLPPAERRHGFSVLALRWNGRGYVNMTLAPVDMSAMEFYLVADGAEHEACFFSPRLAHGPPWPGSPTHIGKGGVQACAWATNDAGQIADSVGYMVLSPSYGLDPAHFSSMLLHHLRYHLNYGITRYLVYVTEGAQQLARDPQIQEFMRAGNLRIILLDEMPVFFRNAWDPSLKFAAYALQDIAYNHALLLVWHELAIVSIADVDEYLATKSMTNISQIVSRCASSPSLVGNLGIQRREAYYTGNLKVTKPLNLSEVKSLAVHERCAWLNASSPHPLKYYGLTTADPYMGTHLDEHSRKSVCVPHRVGVLWPHGAWTVGSFQREVASVDCVVWIHARSQVSFRPPVNYNGSLLDPQPLDHKYLWALSNLNVR